MIIMGPATGYPLWKSCMKSRIYPESGHTHVMLAYWRKRQASTFAPVTSKAAYFVIQIPFHSVLT